MTNQERYKTVEERSEAFKNFCATYKDCSTCPLKTAPCSFLWLAREAEEEKPLPCPFCGGEAEVSYAMFHAYVKCRECHVAAAMSSTKEEALAKWNRRVK